MSYENVKYAFDLAADSVYQTESADPFLVSIIKNLILDSFKMIDDNNITVFEVGCGNGRWMKYILEHTQKNIVKIAGCDLSDKMIGIGKKILKEYINQGKAEIFTHNFVDDEIELKQKYHVIYFIDVFQHLNRSDYFSTLKKVKQLLYPKGLLIIADKEKYSRYGIKMAIKRMFKMVPPYYMTARYPSLLNLRFLANKSGYKKINLIKINQFRGIWLQKK